MGNYISSDLIEERITSTRLDNLCKVTGSDQTMLLDNVISRAEAVIDGYAAGRYQTPLPSNDMIEEWALAIAEYELYKRGSGGDVPVKIRRSYEDVLALLKDLAEGRLTPPGSVAPTAANSSGSSLDINTNSSMMGESDLAGF